ncbi:sensor histidine kinase [Desulfobulbus elongatus]|uniref:sensor histidine kinase n=1 Tax=Desulfobulbus elongatus TaxID=53332 RepID=UPI000A0260BF|nr:ATP-binding protein [Desulfobulbus elongatus]
MKPSPRINYFLALFIFLLVIAWNVWWSFTWLYHQKLKDLAEEGTSRLELYITYLQGVLEKYENFPELLANDRVLVQQLNAPDTPEKINFLNRYLEKINGISNASDIYLMNNEGLTIAASNWQEQAPFVGQNFGYRPYFQEAMQGRLGRYFALGMTSSVRGYYFAYPVRQHDRILGALVLKINIDTVEKNWGHADQTFLVTDAEGVIFLSTKKEWRFRTLTHLPDQIRQRIIASYRYPDVPLEALDVVREERSDAGAIVRVRMTPQHQVKEYLLQTHAMKQAGWNVHILTDTWRVERFVFLAFVTVNAFFALSFLLILLFKQRQQRVVDLKRFEEQTRRVLQEANEQLETRVTERTQELTETNTLLRKEIEDRKRVELALGNTRSELVHAAKMAALGQMSAGISHELNQPLAAIRSYSDNGRLFLEKGRLKEALWNLEQISELTDRMAQIGVQLKQFSRKTSGQLSTVPLHGAIDGALEILYPVIRKTDIWIKVVIDPEDLDVHANHVLLQQVLVNLVSNALHAVEDSMRQEINIRGYRKEGNVILSVADSGPGIAPDHLPHIFEPFFTTKQAGQGLGLGLTITERILREMNGVIRVAATESGAKFECIFEEA